MTKSGLARKSGLSRSTVIKSTKDLPLTYEKAECLSAATGGLCSIDEIRFPGNYKDPEGKKSARRGRRKQKVA